MTQIILNKFEKEKRVIELHLQGKIREIAKEVHMSFRDIGRIKNIWKKQNIALKEKLKTDSSHIKKKLSKSSQAFKLFRDGKKLTGVAIHLQIPAEKVEILWSLFMILERMYECYEFYQDYQYDIPTLLSINDFIKRNNISGNNILNVLRIIKNIINLNQSYSNLKKEINDLEQKKMSLLYYSHSRYCLQHLPLNKPNYNYLHY